ncbi:MAG TPA: hypothetical protein VGN29_18810 [Solirubrobacteraceae bacterium]|nr:hypothetical protein [Solirubrobacteraceae bacterium]
MVAHGRGARLLAFVAAVVAVGGLALARTSSDAGAVPAATSPPGVRAAAASSAPGVRGATGTAAGVGIPKPSPATAKARRRRARADATTLLGRVRLPAGAEQLSSEPTGDGGTLSRPPSRPAITSTLVDEHTWWRVPGSPASALDYLGAHPPRGGKLRESAAQGTGRRDIVSGYDGFVWPPVGRLLGSRELFVQVTKLTGGGTGVRVDAQVQWIIPRPVSERIPRGVHEVDVTRAAPGEAPSLEVKVVSPHKIRALVAMVDALEIVQPGAYACPALPASGPIVTFTFRPSDGGTVLARASEPSSAREPTTSCDPMTFSIRGRPQTPLLGGAAVVGKAGRLLGVHLQTPPSQRPGTATGTPG